MLTYVIFAIPIRYLSKCFEYIVIRYMRLAFSEEIMGLTKAMALKSMNLDEII